MVENVTWQRGWSAPGKNLLVALETIGRCLSVAGCQLLWRLKQQDGASTTASVCEICLRALITHDTVYPPPLHFFSRCRLMPTKT